MTSEMIIKSFRYQKYRYCKYKAILGVGFPIQALHAAYIGEDASVLSTSNVETIRSDTPKHLSPPA